MKTPSVLCSMCADEPASSSCACTGPEVFFCIHCVAFHVSQDPAFSHEVTCLPPDTLHKLAIEGLRKNVEELAAWKRELVSIADYMIARLTDFRDTVEREMSTLQREVEEELNRAVQELSTKAGLKEPTFVSPIARVVFAREAGTILTCVTNFSEMRLAVDAFLFSLNLQLQTDVPGFAPTGLITHKNDISSVRKVNIYYPLAHEFFPFFIQKDIQRLCEQPLPQEKVVPVIHRGPLIFADSRLYFGSWNSENQPHGAGQLLLKSGSIYTGAFQFEKYSGRGKFSWPDGTAYEGEFEGGTRHGFGKRRYFRGFTYTGLWERGNFEGLGELRQDGEGQDCYFGEFASGEKEGRGVHFSKDFLYAGEFRAGARRGKGVLCHDGESFYGEFGANGKKAK